MDDNRKIIRIFPFHKEIEKTEFYSGLLALVPEGISVDWDLLSMDNRIWNDSVNNFSSLEYYNVWHKDYAQPLNR